ncbi:hypothetical protein HAX54_025827, partial [Datura stramonium]|nr:hypothetical protein [Datura stramonium]
MQGLKVARGWHTAMRGRSTLALGQARHDNIPWHCSRCEAPGLPRIGKHVATPSRCVDMWDVVPGHGIDKGNAA